MVSSYYRKEGVSEMSLLSHTECLPVINTTMTRSEYNELAWESEVSGNMKARTMQDSSVSVYDGFIDINNVFQ